MAALTASVRSQRYANQEILVASATGRTGSVADTISLPTGYGDCLLLEAWVQVYNQTLTTIDVNEGPRLVILDAASVLQDFVDSEQWTISYSDEVSARAEPDQPVLWRSQEIVQITFIDTRAAGTFDYRTFFRVRALRNVG